MNVLNANPRSHLGENFMPSEFLGASQLQRDTAAYYEIESIPELSTANEEIQTLLDKQDIYFVP